MEKRTSDLLYVRHYKVQFQKHMVSHPGYLSNLTKCAGLKACDMRDTHDNIVTSYSEVTVKLSQSYHKHMVKLP